MRKFLHEFQKYRDGTKRDNGWWEIKGDYLYNYVGDKYKCQVFNN